MSGNTIFITGASSGIGRGLAEAFHARGNQVIVAARREERLRELCGRCPGMRYFALDVTDGEAVRRIAAEVSAEFPALDCVVNNAGIQARFDFAAAGMLDEQVLRNEIDTNLAAPIRVAAAFIPHLAGRSPATLINVSSGLAFVPMARYPIYCATKAAVHAWTLSLRHQLRRLGIQVIELIPPYVATELGAPGKLHHGQTPMPLDAFVAEAMKELESEVEEVAVAAARNLVAAASSGRVGQVFTGMNRDDV